MHPCPNLAAIKIIQPQPVTSCTLPVVSKREVRIFAFGFWYFATKQTYSPLRWPRCNSLWVRSLISWPSRKGIVSFPLLELKFSHFLVLLCRSIGLLKVGVPKPWDESKKNLGYIRQAGVRQFISTYNRVKDLQGDELLWGDEIEYGVFILDHEQKKVRLSLRAKEVSSSMLFSIFAHCTPLLKMRVRWHLCHGNKVDGI